jgi:hypothetical protein
VLGGAFPYGGGGLFHPAGNLPAMTDGRCQQRAWREGQERHQSCCDSCRCISAGPAIGMETGRTGLRHGGEGNGASQQQPKRRCVPGRKQIRIKGPGVRRCC